MFNEHRPSSRFWCGGLFGYLIPSLLLWVHSCSSPLNMLTPALYRRETLANTKQSQPKSPSSQTHFTAATQKAKMTQAGAPVYQKKKIKEMRMDQKSTAKGLLVNSTPVLLISGDGNPTGAVYPQESGHRQHPGQVNCRRGQTPGVK